MCRQKKLEEREFVVDSGASVQMVSEKDLNSAELETMKISRNPTTVMTANGEVQTREEATVYVKELDLFVKVLLLRKTPAVLSLGETLRRTCVHVSLEKLSKNHNLIKNGKRIDLEYIKLCTICGFWNDSEFFLNGAFICFVIIHLSSS